MQKYIDDGAIVVTGRSKRAKQQWVLNHRVQRESATKRLKSVWWERRHDAGAHGSDVVTAYLGRTGAFPFPKSVYAVRDALAAVVAERPHALVLDFFVGSGTTTHAVALLNAADQGRRKSMVVTNNEVDEEVARRLNKKGIFRGDAAFEEQGIFESVTRPRVESVVRGSRPDQSVVDGAHTWADRRLYAEGFEENIAFFRLDYLDPDVVSVGRQYTAIAPLLWLAAGSVGEWADRDGDEPWSTPDSSNYAVLFDEDRFADFREMLAENDRITHVWLVTNSSQGYVEMRAQLADDLHCAMLYRDYLLNFQVNTQETFS